MNRFRHLFSFCALALFFAVAAHGDTLELKDGRSMRGRYLGGTQTVLRFEVDGDVQTFRLNEVSSITFDRHRRDDRSRDDLGAPPPPDNRHDQSGSAAPPPPSQNAPNDSPAPAAPNGAQPGPNGDVPAPTTSVDQLPPADPNAPTGAQPPPDSSDSSRGDRSREDHSNDPYPPDQSRSNDAPPPPPAPRDSALSADRPDRSRDQYPPDRDNPNHLAYAAPGTPITLPSGHAILVRMIDSVDSKHDEVGDPFHAALETDLSVNGVLVARRGSDVYGRLTYAKNSGRLAGNAELQLELTRIIIEGKEFPIVTGDYTVKGRGRGGDTARNVGGGAVLGAIIGGIAGGGTGAAIGAGVGGAAGAGATAATRGRAIKVPSETLLEFRLDQPVTVTPTQR
jgi:hypothetical protein